MGGGVALGDLRRAQLGVHAHRSGRGVQLVSGRIEGLVDLADDALARLILASAGAQGVFFCYALPGAERILAETSADPQVCWTEEAGPTRWYMYDLRTEKIEEEPARIIFRATSRLSWIWVAL